MYLISLKEIVENVQNDLGEESAHKFSQYLHWAVQGVKMVYRSSLGFNKVAILELRPNKTALFPADYKDWVQVGIQVGDTLQVLSQNKDNLPMNWDKNAQGQPIANKHANDSLDIPFAVPIFSEQLLGYYQHRNYYGYGDGGHNKFGEFRMDYDRNQIVFSSNTPTDTIYLEYISDGIECDGTTKVHWLLLQALVDYVHWQRTRHRTDLIGQAREYERSYWNEMRKAKRAMNALTIEDIDKAVRANYKQTVKL